MEEKETDGTKKLAAIKLFCRSSSCEYEMKIKLGGYVFSRVNRCCDLVR